MTVETIAKVVVVNKAGEVLLLRRSATDTRRPLQWDLPGGVVEHGEDIRAAVIREAAEEAGVTLADPVAVYGYSEPRLPYGMPTWIFFALRVGENPVVTLSFEHDKYRWVALRDAVKDVEYPLHRQLFTYLLDNKVLDYL